MEGLPLVPGYTFHNPTIQNYKLKSKLNFLNGFRVLRDSNVGIGGRPIDAASIAFAGEPDALQFDPSLTYGRVKEYRYQRVVPHYALFAQKCLTFKAFFRQSVSNSPDEQFRVRHVRIIYFLEDDTMSVMEPPVDNSGLQHGRIVRRDKIAKNDRGDVYHWKDLNVGIDIGIYGVAYRVVDCDAFTREFLTSQGIDVGAKEELPPDPYTEYRRAKNRPPSRSSIPVSGDSRRRFLEYDSMVLKFKATWNDDDYQILYFLTDDTIAVREVHKLNDGKDPVSMLLKRTRVPKNLKDSSSNYPTIYMEVGDSAMEYYTPKDLRVGETISIFGRAFLLLDCDAFTRKYYESLGIQQVERLESSSAALPENGARVIPPHIMFGTPEDTLAGCRSLVPKPPRKDVIRQLLNFPKKLRYSMKMEAVHPEDEDRNFVLEYNLGDGTILIVELEKRNSGRRGGTFLSSMFVPKPGTGRDDPVYYTAEDFFIGAKINVFNHRFVVTGADLFVYRYIEANPEKFNDEVRDNFRNHFAKEGLLSEAEAPREEKKPDANRDLKPNVEEPLGDRFDTRTCFDALKDESQRGYVEDEELRPPTGTEYPEFLMIDEPVRMDYRRSYEREKLTPQQERKEITWADQIDEDSAGHPMTPCRKEFPEYQPSVARECDPTRYSEKGDRRLEVGQITYENSTEPRKLRSPGAVPMVHRDPGERTVTMLRKVCPSPYRH